MSLDRKFNEDAIGTKSAIFHQRDRRGFISLNL